MSMVFSGWPRKSDRFLLVVFIFLLFFILPNIYSTDHPGEHPSCCTSCLLVSFINKKFFLLAVQFTYYVEITAGKKESILKERTLCTTFTYINLCGLFITIIHDSTISVVMLPCFQHRYKWEKEIKDSRNWRNGKLQILLQ